MGRKFDLLLVSSPGSDGQIERALRDRPPERNSADFAVIPSDSYELHNVTVALAPTSPTATASGISAEPTVSTDGPNNGATAVPVGRFHDRPGSGGQNPPRVRLAMAMSASGPW